MPYIDKNDFLFTIRLKELDSLVDNDNSLIDTAILIAQAEVNDYISTRYNTSTEFAKTGTARNLNLVSHMVNIALYKLYMRVTPTQIPNNRADLYDGDYVNTGKLGGAIGYLTKVSKSELNVDIAEIDPYKSNRIISSDKKPYSRTF